MFTYCSSSRKVTTPPAGPGISNINVINGKDTVRGPGIQVNPETRDFAYTAMRETALQGTWTLQGMATEQGGWSTTDQWYKDTTVASTVTDTTSMAPISGTSMEPSQPVASTKNKTGKSTVKNRGGKSSLKATRSLQRYDSLMANSVMYTDSALNAGVQPYKYWTRIPTVSLNPATLVFSGTTGCNSMSGSFNFSGKDIRFNKNITTSKMACNEYNEVGFLNLLKKADNYNLNNEGMLELRQGQTVLMVFSKQM